MDFLCEGLRGLSRGGELIGQQHFYDLGIAVQVGFLPVQVFLIGEVQQVDAQEGHGTDGQGQEGQQQAAADF